MLHRLVALIRQADSVRRIASHLASGNSEQMVCGISGSQRTVLVAALFEEMQRLAGGVLPPGSGSILVLTHGRRAAEQWYEDLAQLVGPERLGLFLPLETLPHEDVTTSPELTGQRLDAMLRLLGLGSGPSVVIADVTAASERLVPARVLESFILRVGRGETWPLAEAARILAQGGYERRTRVEGPGQYSVRGDILDVFPLTRPSPVRIEWFDQVVESIREFDADSQRSTGSLEAVIIPPARELPLTAEALQRGRAAIAEEVARQARRLRAAGQADAARRLEERVEGQLERLAEHGYVEGLEQYKPLFYTDLPLLPDYLAGGLVVLDEPARLRERLGHAESEFAETFKGLLERGRVLPVEAGCFGWWDDLVASARRHLLLALSLLPRRLQELEPAAVHSVASRPAEPFHGNWELLAGELRRRQHERFRVLLALSTPSRAERAVELLRDEGVVALRASDLDGELKPGHVVVVASPLESGFELPELRLLVLTDAEVYGRERRPRRPKPPYEGGGVRLGDYLELREGDYVVHVNHGIGRYEGIRTMEVSGVRRDYLVVRYAGEDRLYVPTDQVQLLQKYIGSEDAPPRLNRLGGTEWARIKKRVRESVQEMAEGLLKLYAERQARPGTPFGPDTPWQREFEEAFPYEETPDQLRASQEVKADMERPRPMDRLLCGDVGYGKTEVAMRAAFKAVMQGKQVAVLVPTTILAQQHHRTFTERFEGYPVRIAMLSRFQSPAEQQAVLQGLKRGSVDIVIGTHRLLSRDVEFSDLGLVVVDEEQRFGVAQKERLKELRRTVDVLTMTATPIPRTLHMALSGVRDMSVIETPPEGRLPVRTYVVEYHDELVRDAIERELARGGQVYFVYNRVQAIDRMAAHIQQLVPRARIAVAHGQMEETRLEQVMLDFLRHEYDVLVCTTIIETGMDIANVNTLVVYDADRMGLAQLYQLRGRVGRSNRVAYAYFTFRKEKVLTEDAERRLAAIREFTELGSGFKIALRDLEIRGAGNILGPEQHGHIAAVGFELYCRLLEEAVRELKGERLQTPPEPSLDLAVDAYLPDGYVPDSTQKVEFYKRIAQAGSLQELDEIRNEMDDRFGDPPGAVRNLLAVARIRLRARQAGIGAISARRDEVTLKTWEGLRLPADRVARAVAPFRLRVGYRPASQVDTLWVRRSGMSDQELLALLEDLVGRLAEAASETAKPTASGHDGPGAGGRPSRSAPSAAVGAAGVGRPAGATV